MSLDQISKQKMGKGNFFKSKKTTNTETEKWLTIGVSITNYKGLKMGFLKSASF